MAAAEDRSTSEADDALLVAYLDGALDAAEEEALDARIEAEPALAARLEQLAHGGEGIAAAFDHLLDRAPRAELDAMLDSVLVAHAAPAADAVVPFAPRRAGWRPTLAMAASFLVVAMLAGLAGFMLAGSPKASEGWLQAVAEYWSLTSEKTLALVPSDSLADSQLALAADALGLSLSRADLGLDGPSFRGAQLYDFGGKPLVQIAYLDPDYGPIAFCLIKNDDDDAEPNTIRIGDFGVVHWSSGGFGRMVIGRAPADVLQGYADELRARTG